MSSSRLRHILIGELSWKRLIRSVMFIYAAVVLYLFFFADGMIFLPPPPTYDNNPSLIRIPSRSGRTIVATYLSHPTATHTILYSHGNASDLGQLSPLLIALQNAGFSVLAYDYQGYGLSEGKPSERNTYHDIEAAYGYLIHDLKTPPETIIVHGRSVGGGPSTYLAEHRLIGGLILESTFTKVFRVVVPVKLLPFEKFPNIDRLDAIEVPILIIHGTADERIPFEHSQQLYDAAKPPKQFLAVEGADHNNVFWTDE
ncbi:MAG: alpha/beta hydrolase, partial [Cyanobacteria bacterium J06632_22]